MKKYNGFTLVELMVVVVIVAIFAAIAIPSYQTFIQRNQLSVAKQYMMCVSEQLERYKLKNYSYKGFVITDANIACKTTDKYTFNLVDLDTKTPLNTVSDTLYGLNWGMMGNSQDVRNYSILLTSNGLRCQNKNASGLDYSDTACAAAGSEQW